VEQAVLIRVKDFLIDPAQLWPGGTGGGQPLGLVDLDVCPQDVRLEALPPFPLIGLGDPAHPVARALDAIVESAVRRGVDPTTSRARVPRRWQFNCCAAVAALDPQVRSIKLRAAGPPFSIGGDLEEFGTTRDPATAHLIRSSTLPAVPLARRADWSKFRRRNSGRKAQSQRREKTL